MLDTLRPAHVGDVYEAVNAFFDLDKRTEVGEISDSPVHPGTDRITLVDGSPRIGFELLDAE